MIIYVKLKHHQIDLYFCNQLSWFTSTAKLLLIHPWPAVDAWWRHQMETFSALLAICVWNSPVTGEFPAQRPVTRSFDAFFDLRLNKRLSKQWRGWWFETPSPPLWRHRNGLTNLNWLYYSCIHLSDQSLLCKWLLSTIVPRLFFLTYCHRYQIRFCLWRRSRSNCIK